MKRWSSFAAALMALALLVSATAMGEGAAEFFPEAVVSAAVEAAPEEQVMALGAQANAEDAFTPTEHPPLTLTPGEKRKEKDAASVGDTLILRVDGATVTGWKASPAKAAS